jgi:hypothetical protein
MPSTIQMCNLLLIAKSTTCTTTTSTNLTHTQTVTATRYISFNTFRCFQYIWFSDRRTGQYRREQDLQQHSHGLAQYTVLAIPAETAHNNETNSSQHCPFPGQSSVNTPTFSDQQTSNYGINTYINCNTKTYWTIMNTNFHIVKKACLLYWQK